MDKVKIKASLISTAIVLSATAGALGYYSNKIDNDKSFTYDGTYNDEIIDKSLSLCKKVNDNKLDESIYNLSYEFLLAFNKLSYDNYEDYRFFIENYLISNADKISYEDLIINNNLYDDDYLITKELFNISDLNDENILYLYDLESTFISDYLNGEIINPAGDLCSMTSYAICVNKFDDEIKNSDNSILLDEANIILNLDFNDIRFLNDVYDNASDKVKVKKLK